MKPRRHGTEGNVPTHLLKKSIPKIARQINRQINMAVYAYHSWKDSNLRGQELSGQQAYFSWYLFILLGGKMYHLHILLFTFRN